MFCLRAAPATPAQASAVDSHCATTQPQAVQVTNSPTPIDAPKDRSGWFMAVATVALAAFTWLLWRSTAALVKGADETAKRELRAYVFVNDARIEGVAAGDSPVATVLLKNSGQTPAYKVRVSIRMELRAAFADVPALEEAAALGHLAPGANLTTKAPSVGSLAVTEHARLDSGHVTLFVYGVVHYIDSFKKPHWTRFRTMVGGAAGLRAERPDGSLPLASCTEGNETDDDI